MSAFTTLLHTIQQRAEQLREKPAFVFRDKNGGRNVLSWQQAYDLGSRWAAILRSRSIGRGDLVVNTLPNSPERVITEVGILFSGAASVNGQCQLADGSDLLYVLNKSKAKAIVLDPDVVSSPWNVLKKCITLEDAGCVTSEKLPSLQNVFFVRRVEGDATNDFLSHLRTLSDCYQADAKADDVLAVYTTSGTTGFSKLVVHTHHFLAAIITDNNLRYYTVNETKQHTDFSLAPLGWAGGYYGLTFLRGYTRVLCDVRSGLPADMFEFIISCIQEERCTRVYLSPAFVVQIEERVRKKGVQANVVAEPLTQGRDPSIPEGQGHGNNEEKDRSQATILHATVDPDARCPVGIARQDVLMQTEKTHAKKISWEWIPDSVILGGLPLSRSMVQAARRLAHSVVVGYGATDFSFVSSEIITDASSYVDHDGGKVLHVTKVKIVDPKDEEKALPVGMVGLVLVKRPGMMKEYLNDPEATAAAFTPDGYFRTGDVGCFDDRGHLIVHGRGSDAIMRGPYIFYPGWLEARIRACPGVHDVVVVGVPDPLVNEELCACLVLTSDDVTVEEVRQFVEKDILASEDDPLSPRPRHYLKFQTFPKTYTDKIDRKGIKRIAAARLAE